MLTMFEVTTDDGRFMSFPIGQVTSGYLVTEIRGLDPTKANLVSSSLASLPGAKFQSSKREPRNVVASFRFLKDNSGNKTIEDLRKRLYRFFMPESQVSLKFENTFGLSVTISGVVESFESPIFVKEPAADISIICHDPDLVDVNEVSVAGLTTSTFTELVLDYEGTIKTGFRFVLEPDRSIANFTIHHRSPANVDSSFYLQRSLVSGNVVTVNTTLGDKYARLMDETVQTSILGSVSPASNWPQLSYGENAIRVSVSGAAIPYTLFYKNRYGGL